jgi:hypothetical protein
MRLGRKLIQMFPIALLFIMLFSLVAPLFNFDGLKIPTVSASPYNVVADPQGDRFAYGIGTRSSFWCQYFGSMAITNNGNTALYLTSSDNQAEYDLGIAYYLYYDISYYDVGDVNQLSIAYLSSDQTTIYYRRGTVASDHITWDGVAQVAGTINLGLYDCRAISIETDSSGYPLIAYSIENKTLDGSRVVLTKSSLNNGAWATQAGYPVYLDQTGSYNAYPVVRRVWTDRSMYITWINNAWNGVEYWDKIFGRLYNGTENSFYPEQYITDMGNAGLGESREYEVMVDSSYNMYLAWSYYWTTGQDNAVLATVRSPTGTWSSISVVAYNIDAQEIVVQESNFAPVTGIWEVNAVKTRMYIFCSDGTTYLSRYTSETQSWTTAIILRQTTTMETIMVAYEPFSTSQIGPFADFWLMRSYYDTFDDWKTGNHPENEFYVMSIEQNTLSSPNLRNFVMTNPIIPDIWCWLNFTIEYEFGASFVSGFDVYLGRNTTTTNVDFNVEWASVGSFYFIDNTGYINFDNTNSIVYNLDSDTKQVCLKVQFESGFSNYDSWLHMKYLELSARYFETLTDDVQIFDYFGASKYCPFPDITTLGDTIQPGTWITNSKLSYINGYYFTLLADPGTSYSGNSFNSRINQRLVTDMLWYQTSSNGRTWSEQRDFPMPVEYGVGEGNAVRITYETDGTYIHFIIWDNLSNQPNCTYYYAMATITSSGYLSWISSSWQEVFTLINTYDYTGVSVAIDSNGYPWFSTSNNNVGDYFIFKSTTKNGIFTGSSSIHNITDTYSQGLTYGKLTPLLSGDMYFSWDGWVNSGAYEAIQGVKYTASTGIWGTEETIDNDNENYVPVYNYDIETDGTNIFVLYCSYDNNPDYEYAMRIRSQAGSLSGLYLFATSLYNLLPDLIVTTDKALHVFFPQWTVYGADPTYDAYTVINKLDWIGTEWVNVTQTMNPIYGWLWEFYVAEYHGQTKIMIPFVGVMSGEVTVEVPTGFTVYDPDVYTFPLPPTLITTTRTYNSTTITSTITSQSTGTTSYLTSNSYTTTTTGWTTYSSNVPTSSVTSYWTSLVSFSSLTGCRTTSYVTTKTVPITITSGGSTIYSSTGTTPTFQTTLTTTATRVTRTFTMESDTWIYYTTSGYTTSQATTNTITTTSATTTYGPFTTTDFTTISYTTSYLPSSGWYPGQNQWQTQEGGINPILPDMGAGGSDVSLLGTYLLEGNFFGFIIGVYTTRIGQLFYGLFIFFLSLPLYLRTQSILYCAVLWLLLGGLFIVAVPIISPIAVLFVIFGVTALIYRVFVRD